MLLRGKMRNILNILGIFSLLFLPLCLACASPSLAQDLTEEETESLSVTSSSQQNQENIVIELSGENTDRLSRTEIENLVDGNNNPENLSEDEIDALLSEYEEEFGELFGELGGFEEADPESLDYRDPNYDDAPLLDGKVTGSISVGRGGSSNSDSGGTNSNTNPDGGSRTSGGSTSGNIGSSNAFDAAAGNSGGGNSGGASGSGGSTSSSSGGSGIRDSGFKSTSGTSGAEEALSDFNDRNNGGSGSLLNADGTIRSAAPSTNDDPSSFFTDSNVATGIVPLVDEQVGSSSGSFSVNGASGNTTTGGNSGGGNDDSSSVTVGVSISGSSGAGAGDLADDLIDDFAPDDLDTNVQSIADSQDLRGMVDDAATDRLVDEVANPSGNINADAADALDAEMEEAVNRRIMENEVDNTLANQRDDMQVMLDTLDSDASQGCNGTTIGGVICNVVVSSSDFPGLLSAISYLIGLVMAGLGVWNLKEHVLDPKNMEAIDPIKRFIVGGAFFALPTVLEATKNTISPQDNPYAASNYDATGASSSGLDGMLVRLMDDIWDPMMGLFSAFAYFAGLILIMIGIMRLMKQEKDGPQAPIGLGTMMTFLVGGIMLSADTIMSVFTFSLFGFERGQNTVFLTYSALSGAMEPAELAHVEAVITAVIAFIAIIGWISFLRGFFILRGAAEGNSQMNIMAGLTHIFGGALAVNIGPAINAVQWSLGIGSSGILFQ